MLQVGVLLHQAKSGRLIVRLTREVRPGAPILDDRGRRLGRVVELIGPVRAPYASVAVTSSRIGKASDAAYVEG
ncbi:MAG: Gar1/Naf1 family protein [Nitrososphaerales archaeon]